MKGPSFQDLNWYIGVLSNDVIGLEVVCDILLQTSALTYVNLYSYKMLIMVKSNN